MPAVAPDAHGDAAAPVDAARASTRIAEPAFVDGVLHVRREFVAHPEGQVCQPAVSKELQTLASRIRRDLASVVVFTPRS